MNKYMLILENVRRRFCISFGESASGALDHSRMCDFVRMIFRR